MSDNARWGFTDRAEAKLKPDSEKSTTEHWRDKAQGKTDSAAAHAQPESEKSYTQKVGDKFHTSSNTSSNTLSSNNDDRSLMDKTKNALGMGNSN